ncbi:hypothetical protein AAFC00_000980 [Neodothiora populina]|uniref:Uncharacterized protein n=1 Tax=Neodothiora populina TaxID=2781224 RepID=A0ABR3PMG4_9PEZI
MPFQYKKVLLIGATSGIGEALANRIAENGVFVIVTGRRQDKLDEVVSKHGSEKAAAVQWDITKLDEIPAKVEAITKAHADIDCVMLNSGIQRGLDFSKPESIDKSAIHDEFNTNYLSYLHVVTEFLPYLQKQSRQTSLAFTTSGLALTPLLRCPNYCASKAALHHFILVLREQLKNGPGNVKVIEIFPPAVQTELHDAKHQPDIENGGSIGMPLKEFVDDTWAGLEAGEEQIAVGLSKRAFDSWEQDRQKGFFAMNQAFLDQAQKS